ncbi:MAG: hypothetical protein M3Y87_12090 [Myxococcota bacterium]|nr:hypothetical protein [Myxococcota bacterium]
MEALARKHAPLALWLATALTLSGCQLVAGVFKAGVWIGVLAVLLFVGLAAGVATFVKRRRGGPARQL